MEYAEGMRGALALAGQGVIAVWFGMVCGFAVGFSRGRRSLRE